MATAANGLNKGIAEWYDAEADVLEGVLGEHFHHGFYELGASSTSADHDAARTRIIEEALRFAGISDEPEKRPKRIVDVGCGVGGSSRYLAKKYGAQVVGITLSPVQVQRARALSAAAGLGDKVSFQVADAFEQPFPDGEFDLVWSLASGEHMPDRVKFIKEMVRVAKPGAAIIIVPWCHRELSPSEDSLTPDETHLLNRIAKDFELAPWCPASHYVNIAKSLKLEDIKSADWSEHALPFWSGVTQAQLSEQAVACLLKIGPMAIKGAQVLPLMIEAGARRLITYPIITCRKPE